MNCKPVWILHNEVIVPGTLRTYDNGATAIEWHGYSGQWTQYDRVPHYDTEVEANEALRDSIKRKRDAAHTEYVRLTAALKDHSYRQTMYYIDGHRICDVVMTIKDGTPTHPSWNYSSRLLFKRVEDARAHLKTVLESELDKAQAIVDGVKESLAALS